MQENKNNTLKNTPKEDPPELEVCDYCADEVESTIYNDSTDEDLCQGCADDLVECPSCNELFHEDDLMYLEDSGASWCVHCCENYAYYDEDRERYCEREPQRIIYPYDYKPETVFHWLENNAFGKRYGYSSGGRLYAGVELEVENQGERHSQNVGGELIESLNGNFGRNANIYLKEDGSISEGFEVVSQPRTWRSWKQSFKQFEPVFNLSEYGFRSHDTETCGLHISLSKNAFSESHLLRFQKFIYFNPDFIRVLSRRKLENLIEWGNPYAIDRTHLTPETIQRRLRSELDREFCEDERYDDLTIEDDETPFYRHKLLKMFVNHNGAPIYTSKALRQNRKNKRGTALNLPRGENRVELRFFRGTLKRGTFKLNLEFSFCAFDFTKDTNADSLTVQNLRNFAQKQGYKRVFNYLDALPWGHRERWSQDYKKTIKAETVALSGGNPIEGGL